MVLMDTYASMLDLKVRRGLATHYYVASELALQGLIPLPTIKNEKGFDITAINPENGKSVNIQVRVQSGSSEWWSANTSNIPNLVYMFVHLTRESKFDTFYVLPKSELEQVRRTWESKGGITFVTFKENMSNYERKWEVIQDLLR